MAINISNISKKLAQQIVETVKDVCQHDINFIDPSGIIFASTDTSRIGDFHEIGKKAADSKSVIEVAEHASGDIQYTGTKAGVNTPLFHNGNLIAVIGISGDPESARKYAALAERITLLLIREQELNISSRNRAEQRDYIIDSLLKHETIDHEYLVGRLSDWHLDEITPLRAIIIKINPRYNIQNLSIIQQSVMHIFNMSKTQLYTFHHPNEYISVISEKNFDNFLYMYENFAQKNAELLSIGIGCSCTIYHLAESYATGLTAQKSTAASGLPIAIYDNLNLELILSNIDPVISSEYIKKVLGSITNEERDILRVYYTNNMSLSKTSEALFIHKNTLQYRLNHIHEITSMNPRNFKDAVVFYIAIRLLP